MGQTRVLVVDDDPSIRLMVTKALENHGFNVDSAKDGVEAVEKLAAETYDLVVLDLMMPRLDGFDVLDQMENTIARERPPKVLIMTAAAPSVLQKLPQHRLLSVLSKPFDISALVEAAKALRESSRDDPAK